MTAAREDMSLCLWEIFSVWRLAFSMFPRVGPPNGAVVNYGNADGGDVAVAHFFSV